MKHTQRKKLASSRLQSIFTAFFAVVVVFSGMLLTANAQDQNSKILEEITNSTTPNEGETSVSPESPEESNGLNTDDQQKIKDEIKDIHNQIEEKQKELDALQDEIGKYDNAIKVKQQEQATLENEISLIETQVKKAELDIRRAEDRIGMYELQIGDLGKDIAEKQNDIHSQEAELAHLIRKLDQLGRKTSLELVVANNSFSDFYTQAHYISSLGKDTQSTLDRIQTLKTSLEEQKSDVEEKKKGVEAEKVTIERQKTSLDDSQDRKQYLLDETQLSEEKFQELVKQFKAQHLESEQIINSLEQEAQERLNSLKGGADEIVLQSADLIWPVYPAKGISAYFLDPTYPFRNIIGEHTAIDIPVLQGTQVKAAEDGVVAVAKNGGKGYSYILLVHADGLSTVYGHVSRIDVIPDQVVRQGDVIGLSGGRPGFPGAGLSTGPHVHFGVRKNGIPVDPLQYLDNSILP